MGTEITEQKPKSHLTLEEAERLLQDDSAVISPVVDAVAREVLHQGDIKNKLFLYALGKEKAGLIPKMLEVLKSTSTLIQKKLDSNGQYLTVKDLTGLSNSLVMSIETISRSIEGSDALVAALSKFKIESGKSATSDPALPHSQRDKLRRILMAVSRYVEDEDVSARSMVTTDRDPRIQFKYNAPALNDPFVPDNTPADEEDDSEGTEDDRRFYTEIGDSGDASTSFPKKGIFQKKVALLLTSGNKGIQGETSNQGDKGKGGVEGVGKVTAKVTNKVTNNASEVINNPNVNNSYISPTLSSVGNNGDASFSSVSDMEELHRKQVLITTLRDIRQTGDVLAMLKLFPVPLLG